MKVGIIPVGVRATIAETVSTALAGEFDVETIITSARDPPTQNGGGIFKFLSDTVINDGEEIMERIGLSSKFDKVLIVYNNKIKDSSGTMRFGMSYLNGSHGVISMESLQPESEKFENRLQKQAIKHLGYMRGLHYCDNNDCVLQETSNLSELDNTSDSICNECRSKLTNTSEIKSGGAEEIKLNEFGELLNS